MITTRGASSWSTGAGRLLVCAAALTVPIDPVAAKANALSASVAHTLTADYHDDNGDRDKNNDFYADVRNRLNLRLWTSRATLSMRLDSATFVQPPSQAAPPFTDRYALEKVTASWNNSGVRLTAGDFYATFGRGIVLSIRKVDELDLDTTLRGAKAQVSARSVRATLVAGLSNPTNHDGVTEKTVEDPYDLITGVGLSWSPARTLSMGCHTVGILFDPLDRSPFRPGPPERLGAVGVWAELTDVIELGSLFAEVDWLGTQTRQVALRDGRMVAGDLERPQGGYAGYVGADIVTGPWSLLAEGKLYKHLDISGRTPEDGGRAVPARLLYNRPPTLEPEDTEIDNNHDVWGGRVAADYQPAVWITRVLAEWTALMAADPSGAGNRLINHGRLGAEADFGHGGRLSVSLGLRNEHPDHPKASRESLAYVRASATVPLARRHSLEAQGWHHRVKEGTAGNGSAPSSSHVRGLWSVGYGLSRVFDVSVAMAYDTSPSGRSALTVYHGTGVGRQRQVFFSASLGLRLFDDVLHLRTLVGSTAGGPQCADGYCRYVPPFSGARVESVLRL